MRLKHYWNSGGTVEFDPDSGGVTVGSGETTLPLNWGSVWKQRGRWFGLWHDGGVEFQFSYWFKGALAAHIDPTYDRLEDESDDFFLYVFTMWEYWKDRSADEFEALAREADLPPQ